MKTFWKYLFLLLSTSAAAQNLVPNPSFEDTVACPTMGGQIYFATGWENCGITPDYFNSCNTGLLGTPANAWGYQLPLNGNAYVGIACNLSTVPNVREYFGRQLSQTLAIGQNYYASFYVSLSDIPSGNCAISKLGIKFSTVPYDSSAPPLLDNFAHVFTSSIISNEISWTKISGWFTADSAYSYVMLGNFFDNANIDTLNCPTQAGTASYYFFEMVCVSTDSSDCFLENPNQIYNASSILNTLKIFPQPAREILNITSLSLKIEKVEIYSAVGELVYIESFDSIENIVIPVNILPDGVYLISVVTNTKNFIYKFLVIH